MTPEQKKRFKLKVIQEMNSRIAASSNLSSIFKPAATEVTMPAKEYDVLIKAQDALKEMIRGVADGKAVKESERLKLYQVLVWEYGSSNAPTDVVIILAKGPDSAERNALFDLGLSDPGGKIKLSVVEIKGPFIDGTVISNTRQP